jgi:hypothetical protein
MRAVGNGWYYCSVEAQVNFSVPVAQAGALYGKVSLDQGTGSMVEKSTYIGDNLSGVYGWRTSMLPPRAWDFNETVFFDDFDDDTMSNIDLTNSRAPGFTWYRTVEFPAFDNPAAPPNVLRTEGFSCADSVLTTTNGWVRTLSSFASLWDRPAAGEPDRQYTTDYVGTGYVVPGLFETRVSWDPLRFTSGHAFWTHGIEYMVIGRELTEGKIPTTEGDFMEIYGFPLPLTHVHYIVGPTGPGTTHQLSAYPADYSDISIWSDDVSYAFAQDVEHLGIRYTSLRVTTRGAAPAATPLDWGPYTPIAVGADLPTSDYSQFHTYSAMWFPATDDEPGQILTFFDGQFASYVLTYGPGLPESHGVSSALIHQNDWQQQILFLGGGPDEFRIDWVKVTK